MLKRKAQTIRSVIDFAKGGTVFIIISLKGVLCGRAYDGSPPVSMLMWLGFSLCENVAESAKISRYDANRVTFSARLYRAS
jgi:hypothetical protein